MQSLVRTTVVVAGLAALGVGLAAPAFAAPDVSGVGSVPTAPTTDKLSGAATAFTTASDAVSALPDQFHFELPAVHQSAPVGALPSVPSAAVPSASVPAAASTPSH